MKKRKMVVSFIMLFVTLYSMAFHVMAAEIGNSLLSADKIITVDEFDELMANMEYRNVSRIITCCNGRPNLVWRHMYTLHVRKEGGGLCLGVSYYGDQYCTKCGSVWQTGVCYKHTNVGCGQYHN